MWPFRKKETGKYTGSPIFLRNTLGGKKEVFVPLTPGFATLYSCGPTVYSQAHIGNLRSYIFSDVLARTLISAGYRLRRVINITDVGHLTGDNHGDADTGEDRMEIGAKREGLRAEDIADRYTALFLEDIRALGVDTTDILFPRATQYIQEQLAMIAVLQEHGYTYKTHDGIYFDTTKFPAYGALGGNRLEAIKNGTAATLEERVQHARIAENKDKRHPADFALWKFSPLGVKRLQEWQSPWGRGFPGWHLECSAMSKALLGTQIDIHTGGVDHIPVHHTNEIAQSEGVSHKQFVRYWMHGAFLTVSHERIGKSVGNAIYVNDISARGYHPLALRYLFLQAHYSSPLSFTWEALAASNEALERLWKLSRALRKDAKDTAVASPAQDRIITILRDDLSTPQALAFLWETLKDEDISPKAAWGVLVAADEILGLSLLNPPETSAPLQTTDIPLEIQEMLQEREAARLRKDFAHADELRIHIQNSGYAVDDGPSGAVISKR